MKKKRIAVIVIACVLIIGILAGCSLPDGKKLLQDAFSKNDETSYTIVSLNISMEPAEGAGAELSKANIIYSVQTKDGSMCIVDLDTMVDDRKATAKLYQVIDGSSVNLYAYGSDGILYGLKMGADSSALSEFNVFSQYTGSITSAEAWSVLNMLCSEYKTLGKEKIGGNDMYVVQAVFDESKIDNILSMVLTNGALGDMSSSEVAVIKGIAKKLLASMQLNYYVYSNGCQLGGASISIDKSMLETILPLLGSGDVDSLIKSMEMKIDMILYYDTAWEASDSAPNFSSAVMVESEEEFAQHVDGYSALSNIFSSAE